MARKQTNKANNELLIPTLALTAIVMVLVGVLTVTMSTPTAQPEVAANNRGGRQLTRGNEVSDLQSDLLLLREDSVDTEISALRQLR